MGRRRGRVSLRGHSEGRQCGTSVVLNQHHWLDDLPRPEATIEALNEDALAPDQSPPDPNLNTPSRSSLETNERAHSHHNLGACCVFPDRAKGGRNGLLPVPR